ncbi:autoinducer binding domain-containing protein [Rhizobium sp. MHM7A]|uniref:helix-turn-helix transcriptional regulator n=1 Tax=Rhizobium sp. MHM7A TaxID=2583233 RepID=UPI001486D3DC|nr:autoinducer binding domain-containing protein [Rhizobium sp. MHM7A]
MVGTVVEISAGVAYSIHEKDAQIAATLKSFARDIQASFIAFHVYNHAQDRQVVFTSGFHEFYDGYVASDAFHADPVMQAARTQRTPFDWQDVISSGQDKEKFCSELLTAGIHCLSIPAGNKDFTAALHIASNLPEATWRHHIADVIWFGTMVAKQLFQRVLRTRPTETPEIKLDKIQTECLSLLAAGKDLDDVATLTGKRQATVSRHVAEAMSRLNANNQTHAIVMAHFLGLILIE